MHRERRLDVGEGRDDDAPDALDGVERQDAAMALDQLAHHVGLARRAERRADLLGLLHLDQAVDDVAARHQQAMDLLVDRVDLLAQFLRARAGPGGVGHVPWTLLETFESALVPEQRRCGRRTVALIRKDGALKAKRNVAGEPCPMRSTRPRLTRACLDEKPPRD